MRTLEMSIGELEKEGEEHVITRREIELLREMIDEMQQKGVAGREGAMERVGEEVIELRQRVDAMQRAEESAPKMATHEEVELLWEVILYMKSEP